MIVHSLFFCFSVMCDDFNRLIFPADPIVDLSFVGFFGVTGTYVCKV